MVDFKLADEQKQYQQLARDFAQKEIAPKAAHYDESGDFPVDICRQAWEIGLMNVRIGEAWGGLGLSVFDACLIAEEIGAGCTGIGASIEANNLAQAPLIVAASDELKKQFLEPFASELIFASYCVAEPESGSDLSMLKTTARRQGDEYIVSGRKKWITNAGHASWFFLLATGDPTQGDKALTAFVVPRDLPGIEVGDREPTMGQRARDSRSVTFADVRIPRSHVIGQEGEGLAVVEAALEHCRPLMAAAAVGLARGAMEHSVRYAKERTTFGQQIANHQAVSFMLADMAKDIEAARLLSWQAAWLADQGMRSCVEASICKSFAADMAAKVATDAVQVFGGYGYSREYPVEKLMRDAKMLQIYEGTSQIQRVEYGKHLVGVS